MTRVVEGLQMIATTAKTEAGWSTAKSSPSEESETVSREGRESGRDGAGDALDERSGSENIDGAEDEILRGVVGVEGDSDKDIKNRLVGSLMWRIWALNTEDSITISVFRLHNQLPPAT